MARYSSFSRGRPIFNSVPDDALYPPDSLRGALHIGTAVPLTDGHKLYTARRYLLKTGKTRAVPKYNSRSTRP